MTEMLKKEFSRSSFLKGGALVVGFSVAGAGLAGKAGAATPATSAGYLPDATRVESYLTSPPTTRSTSRPARSRSGTASRPG